MRHRKKSEKFSRSRAQRKALIKAMLRAVVQKERINTTRAKAKAMRRYVDRLITIGKEDTLAARRRAFAILEDHKLVKKLFDNIAPRFKNINGGYTRVYHLGFRKGDGAAISCLELTKMQSKVKVKKVDKKTKTLPEETKQETSTVTPVKNESETKDSFLGGVKKFFKKNK